MVTTIYHTNIRKNTSYLTQVRRFPTKSIFKSKRLRWAGYVARMEKDRSAFKMLAGTTTRKIPLGRSRRGWEDYIRMDLKEIGISTRNWVNSTQDRDY